MDMKKEEGIFRRKALPQEGLILLTEYVCPFLQNCQYIIFANVVLRHPWIKFVGK